MKKASIFSVFILFVLCGVFFGAKAMLLGEAIDPEVLPETVAMPQKEEAPEGDTVVVVSSYIPPYTQDELLAQSTLVVRGTVEHISDPFVIRGVGGIGELVHTDYTVSVSEVIRGSLPQTASSVVVRIEGDPADASVIYESAPVLEAGKELLLFLQKPGCGGGFNTAGDYYYIVGSKQGVYENMTGERSLSRMAAGDQVFISQKLLYIAEHPEGEIPQVQRQRADAVALAAEKNDDGILRLRSFAQSAKTMEAVNPVDDGMLREQVEENYRTNLQTGMLSEQEYQTAMAELDQFATIVESE